MATETISLTDKMQTKIAKYLWGFAIVTMFLVITTFWEVFNTNELLSQDIPANLECVHQPQARISSLYKEYSGLYMCRGDYHGTN